jgi:PAS domain S-box-containing protein
MIIEGIINTIPVRVFWKDRNLNYLGCNKIFAQDAGLNDPDKIIGKDDFQMVWKEQAELYRTDDLEVITSGVPKLLIEETQTTPEGKQLSLLTSKIPLRNSDGEIIGILGTYLDVSERKVVSDILKVRESLLEYSFHSTLEDLLRKALDETETVTRSKIAFFHFVENDQKTISLQAWSTNTLKTCKTEIESLHYPVDQAGVWAECIHSRSVIVHNNYISLLHRKGLPEGHSTVVRELVVPIFRNNKIVAILGVGNKEFDYDETDIERVRQIADISWDIAVRKKAEDDLKDSEERFKLAFKTSPDSVNINRLKDGMYVDINDGFTNITGYTKEDVFGKTSLEINIWENPGDRAKLVSELQNHGKVTNMDARFRLKNGNVIEGLMSAVIILLSNEPHIISITRDISERKKIEWALKESEAIFNNFMEFSPVYIFFKDENIRPIRLSKNYEQMLGLPVSEMLGKSMNELFPSTLAEAMVEDDKKILASGKMVKVDEELNGHFYTTIKFPIQIEDRPRYLAGFTIDITERKLAEKAIQESEAKYKTIFESTGTATLIVEENKKITMANAECFNTTGYKPDELIGMNWTDFVSEESLAEMVNNHELRRKDPESAPKKYQVKLINKKGEERYAILDIGMIPFTKSSIVSILDITEVKLAEEALRESEEKYRTLITQSPDGIFVVDLSGKFLSVNNSMSVELGFSEKEFLSMNISSIIPENYIKQFEARLKKIINGKGISESIEYKVKGKFGRIIYVEVLSAPYYKGNKLIGFQGIARNITERKIAEQSLRRSREEFKNYFDSSTVGLSVTAPNKSWIEVNQRFCEIMGYSKEEILKLDWETLTHPDDLTENLKLFNQVLEGKIDSYKILKRFLKKDGSIVYISLSTICQRNAEGSVSQFLTSYIDITERKLAEDALTESKILFQTLADVSPVGIFRTTPDGNINYVNPTWSIISGLSVENALEDGWLSAVHPDDRDKIKNEWQYAIKSKKESFADYRFLLADGTIRWVMGQAVPEIGSKNQVVGYIGTITDITQRKKAEEDILESRKQMKELYARLTDIRENERADISREIHDQLGQSLTALKIDLNWLKDKMITTSEMNRKLQGMIDIVNVTIKDVQRISSDLRPGMLDDLGLASAIQWYSQEFEKRTGISCHLQLDEPPDMDSKVSLALFRILQEALTNVIRHANAKNVEIKLYLYRNNIILEIIDDGVGIKSNQINHKYSLGLVGIRERVNQFNGSFELNSEENNGTSLTVTIPNQTVDKK